MLDSLSHFVFFCYFLLLSKKFAKNLLLEFYGGSGGRFRLFFSTRVPVRVFGRLRVCKILKLKILGYKFWKRHTNCVNQNCSKTKRNAPTRGPGPEQTCSESESSFGPRACFPLQEIRSSLKETRFPLKEILSPIKETRFPLKERCFPLKETWFSQKETSFPLKERCFPLKEAWFSQKETSFPLKETRLPLQETRVALKETWKQVVQYGTADRRFSVRENSEKRIFSMFSDHLWRMRTLRNARKFSKIRVGVEKNKRNRHVEFKLKLPIFSAIIAKQN